MTTYFYRNPDGSEYSHVLPNVAPVYLATALVPGSRLGPHWQSMVAQPTSSSITPDDGRDGDCTTGDGDGTTGDDEWHETDDGYYSNFTDNPLGAGYVREFVPGSVSHGIVGTYLPTAFQYHRQDLEYPNPDLIRHYHTLHSLLPYLHPARLENSMFGPTLDIMEEGTDHRFATAVPKKMLVLFCGRNVLNRFLRTLDREDNENWQGGPVTQQLSFPRHYTNHVGVKIVIAWMHRACVTPTKAMKQIRVPIHTFAALSLSRALAAFGLHRDASRVDHIIATNHFKRPLDFDNVVSIWNCLPKDSKYVYRMVDNLRRQLCKYENGDRDAFPDAEKVLDFLEQHDELMARVQDEEYNNRQEFRPFFGTEWCERAALRTQQMITSLVDMKGDEASRSRERNRDITVPKLPSGKGRSGRQNNDEKKGPVQSRKPIVTLNDREPKLTPTAWPQFKKPVVLKILEAQEKEHGHSGGRTDSAYDSDDKSLQC